jgi:hypothetical protein
MRIWLLLAALWPGVAAARPMQVRDSQPAAEAPTATMSPWPKFTTALVGAPPCGLVLHYAMPNCCRSVGLCTLPVALRGSASTNLIERGCL